MDLPQPATQNALSATDTSPPVPWLGWAAYLGASWTWCIGMFLPVLLVRDYGFFGWLVFAIPNVAGAAAMGWVMNSRERSRRVITQHRVACVAFSLVTIVFHVFFASWFIRAAMGPMAQVALVILALAIWFVGRGTLRADVWMGVGALVLSVIAFVVLVIAERSVVVADDHMAVWSGATNDLVWLAVACCFGFALCPYLDLTFHRARLETSDDDAKSAFQVGFGVFFFAMILFTLWYSRFVDTRAIPRFTAPLVVLLLIHMLVQSGYTIALHFREVQRWVTPRAAILLLVAALVSIIFFATFRIEPATRYGARTGEIVYRVFMSFYGLVFPAYAWLCMLPFRKRPLLPPFAVFALAAAAAVPLYWFAFIDGEMADVGYGLGILVIARILLHIPRLGQRRIAT